jgi:hypothetical protein
MKIVFDDDREDIIIGKRDDKKVEIKKPAAKKPKGSAGKPKKGKKDSK